MKQLLQLYMSTLSHRTILSYAVILILRQLLSLLLLLRTGVMESEFLIKWFPNIQKNNGTVEME